MGLLDLLLSLQSVKTHFFVYNIEHLSEDKNVIRKEGRNITAKDLGPLFRVHFQFNNSFIKNICFEKMSENLKGE